MSKMRIHLNNNLFFNVFLLLGSTVLSQRILLFTTMLMRFLTGPLAVVVNIAVDVAAVVVVFVVIVTVIATGDDTVAAVDHYCSRQTRR